MTLQRLICACYNVYPGRTKINIVDCKTTSWLFFGGWLRLREYAYSIRQFLKTHLKRS